MNWTVKSLNMTINFSNNNAFIDSERKESYPSASLANFSDVNTYNLFDALTYWNKLEYMNHSVDKVLLTEIKDKTPSKQLRALATYRLYKLEA